MTATLPQLIYAQTARGILEVEERGIELPRELALVFRMVDGESTFSDLMMQLGMRAALLRHALDTLTRRGYVEIVADAEQAQEQKQGASEPVLASASDSELARELTARVQSEVVANAERLEAPDAPEPVFTPASDSDLKQELTARVQSEVVADVVQAQDAPEPVFASGSDSKLANELPTRVESEVVEDLDPPQDALEPVFASAPVSELAHELPARVESEIVADAEHVQAQDAPEPVLASVSELADELTARVQSEVVANAERLEAPDAPEPVFTPASDSDVKQELTARVQSEVVADVVQPQDAPEPVFASAPVSELADELPARVESEVVPDAKHVQVQDAAEPVFASAPVSELADELTAWVESQVVADAKHVQVQDAPEPVLASAPVSELADELPARVESEVVADAKHVQAPDAPEPVLASASDSELADEPTVEVPSKLVVDAEHVPAQDAPEPVFASAPASELAHDLPTRVEPAVVAQVNQPQALDASESVVLSTSASNLEHKLNLHVQSEVVVDPEHVQAPGASEPVLTSTSDSELAHEPPARVESDVVADVDQAQAQKAPEPVVASASASEPAHERPARVEAEVVAELKQAQALDAPELVFLSTSASNLAHELTVRVQSERRARDEPGRNPASLGHAAKTRDEFPALRLPDTADAVSHLNSVPPPQTVPPASPVASHRKVSTQPQRVETPAVEHRPLHERLHADRAAHDVLVDAAKARHSTSPVPGSRSASSIVQTRPDNVARKALTPQQARDRAHTRRAFCIAIAAVPLLMIGWLQFVHLNSYIPSVQHALFKHFGHPTTVARVQYVLLPTPRVVLEDVRIGESPGIKIGRIEAHAWPSDFMGGWLSFNDVEAQRVTIHPAMLAAIPAWSRTRNPDGIHLERLKLTQVKLGVPSSQGPGLDGEIRFLPNGALKHAALSAEGMELELIPAAAGIRVKLKARDWQPPLSWPLTLNELMLEGIADTQHFASTVLNARTGGGLLTGHLNARWEGPLNLVGQFELKGARLHEILPRDVPALNLKGVLHLNASYAMHADAKTGVLKPQQIDASFAVTRGELMNADLLRAIQSAGSPTAGGRTPFDTLKGAVTLSQATYSYRDMHLSSGLVGASGNFDVAPDGRLSGRINAEMRARGAVVRTPLKLSGTLQGSRLSR